MKRKKTKRTSDNRNWEIFRVRGAEATLRAIAVAAHTPAIRDRAYDIANDLDKLAQALKTEIPDANN